MAIYIDPILPFFVAMAIVVLVIGAILRYFKQPHVLAYIVAGIILGPHALGVITDKITLGHLGNVGVVILLFFVGMEVSLPRLISNWRVALIGTLFQIIISILFVWLIGAWFGWTLNRLILIGFVISISSTAVVLKILQQWKELNSRVGQNVLSILLVQDVAIVPMIIILSFLGGKSVIAKEVGLQIFGSIIIIALIAWIIRGGKIKLPFSKFVAQDHEIQIFSAFLLCFGIALITGLLGLSTALGAFVAGILVTSAKETKWVHKSLDSFRVVFVALFFVSIGMLIDLNFIKNHMAMLFLLLIAVFITNTFINAGILRLLGSNWKRSLYAGAFLSQIGEFSFILGALGLQIGIINELGYQTTIAVISLTLLFSPLWISIIKHFTQQNGISKDRSNPA